MRVNWTEQAMGLLVAAVEHYAKAHDPVKAYQTFDQVDILRVLHGSQAWPPST